MKLNLTWKIKLKIKIYLIFKNKYSLFLNKIDTLKNKFFFSEIK